ncbi:hypothetical protein E0504_01605 [Parafrankia sp. BMG5.11]|nr:hypothetical protein E0504_01605 [Parafrankia sp. BMG5.11]
MEEIASVLRRVMRRAVKSRARARIAGRKKTQARRTDPGGCCVSVHRDYGFAASILGPSPRIAGPCSKRAVTQAYTHRTTPSQIWHSRFAPIAKRSDIPPPGFSVIQSAYYRFSIFID